MLVTLRPFRNAYPPTSSLALKAGQMGRRITPGPATGGKGAHDSSDHRVGERELDTPRPASNWRRLVTWDGGQDQWLNNNKDQEMQDALSQVVQKNTKATQLGWHCLFPQSCSPAWVEAEVGSLQTVQRGSDAVSGGHELPVHRPSYGTCFPCHPFTPDLQVTEYRGLNLKEGSWTVLAGEVTVSFQMLSCSWGQASPCQLIHCWPLPQMLRLCLHCDQLRIRSGQWLESGWHWVVWVSNRGKSHNYSWRRWSLKTPVRVTTSEFRREGSKRPARRRHS